MLTELIGANVEKQRQIIANTYDKQISDVKIKLETEKNLTVKAKEATAMGGERVCKCGRVVVGVGVTKRQADRLIKKEKIA